MFNEKQRRFLQIMIVIFTLLFWVTLITILLTQKP